MSLTVLCAECGKTISHGISGMSRHLGDTPDMLDTMYAVSVVEGYDGTITGTANQTLGNSLLLCGTCLKEKLPNIHQEMQKL